MLDLSDLMPGQHLQGRLAVRRKRGMARYQGGHYYTLVLGNATGELPAKVWQGPDEAAVRQQYEAVSSGDVLRVRARVNEYRDQLELSLDQPPEPVEPELIEPTAFVPSAPGDTRARARRLISAARSLQDPTLEALTLALWEDEDRQEALLQAPGGTRDRHACLGGLVQRVHGLVQLVDPLCQVSGALDRDLLLGGVLLAEVGQIEALRWDGAIRRTRRGHLVGLGALSDEIIQEAADEIDGPDLDRLCQLRHLILARPRRRHAPGLAPSTPEALVLHALRDLESEITRVLAEQQALLEAGDRQGWSRRLGCTLLVQ